MPEPEPPWGIDRELFAGPDHPETPTERACRLDVAHAVLAELREAGRIDAIHAQDAECAAALLRQAEDQQGDDQHRKGGDAA